MANVFDLLETQLCFPGVDSDLFSAKALEHSSCIGEEVFIGLAVYEYIVDVYFTYVVDKAVGDLAPHAALKVRASPLQSHGDQSHVENS